MFHLNTQIICVEGKFEVIQVVMKLEFSGTILAYRYRITFVVLFVAKAIFLSFCSDALRHGMREKCYKYTCKSTGCSEIDNVEGLITKLEIATDCVAEVFTVPGFDALGGAGAGTGKVAKNKTVITCVRCF